jgi:hypothetical protein
MAACVEEFPRFRPVSVAFKGPASCCKVKLLNTVLLVFFFSIGLCSVRRKLLGFSVVTIESACKIYEVPGSIIS